MKLKVVTCLTALTGLLCHAQQPAAFGAQNDASGKVAASDYFPPPESKRGWRKLEKPEDIGAVAGMNPDKLASLRQWLLDSDKRNFAAVVIRNGHIVLEVERGNSAKTDSRRVASVSKAVCATVMAIASEQSQRRLTPRKMTFNDLAFDFIPWAQPLSDPRKAKITIRQLLNHTSGLCPEASGAPNDGKWEYVLGHAGDKRTTTPEMRFQLPAETFSHAWELAARRGEKSHGIPADAHFKPGSGGQLIAFVPSLNLVITRQTGSSGELQFEEYQSRACEAILP